jgi:phage tail tape-measure protein
MNVRGDGQAMLSDTARAAQDASAALTSLYTAWSKFADSRLATPLKATAAAIDALGSEGADKAIKWAAIGTGVVGGMVLARKAQTGVRSLFGRSGGLAGAAGAGGLGGMKLPLPVYVVNSKMSLMPGEMGGGSNRASKIGGAVSGRGGKIGKLLGRSGKYLGRAGGGALVLGVGALDLASTWSDDTLSQEDKVAATSSTTGAMIGSIAGGVIGSALGPAGTIAGGMLGGYIGDVAGSLVGDMLNESERQKKDEAELKSALRGAAKADVKVQMEASPELQRLLRTSTRVDQRGFGNVDVDTGPYMPGVGR